MLGKFVRVRITNPVGSLNRQYGYRYSLNFGSLEGRRQFDNRFAGAYIMGVHHPVRHFDGRAIAVLYREGERKGILVVAPKNMRFIGYQIADALAFAEPEGTYRLEWCRRMPQNKRRDQTSSHQEQPQRPLGIPQGSHGARRDARADCTARGS